MKRKRHLLLAALFAMTSALSACGRSAVTTEHPVVGDIRDTVDESGTVYYAEHYTITSSVSGRIATCSFEAGDLVERGQTLYTIEDTDLSNRISSAQISLDTARAAHRQAAGAAEDLSVKSYQPGMVTEVYCAAGDYISTGSRVARVVDSTRLKLTLAYAGTEAIQPGAAAAVSVSGDSTELGGTVTSIYGQTTVFDGRQTGVFVEITFDNPGALKSGETATAMINGAAPIASGTIEYVTDHEIHSTGTGLVTEIKAPAGSVVSPGSVILLVKNDAVTNAVTNTGLGVSNAEEALRQLNSALDDYTVKAPVSGTILERTAKASDIAAAAAPLAILSSGDTVQVEVDVDEKYISKVALGQSAVITPTSGEGGAVYNGVVKEISDSGTVTNGVTYYTVTLTLDRQDGLMDGMNVDVSILIEAKEHCLLVPKAYLMNGSQIEVLEHGKTVVKDVVVGITDSRYAEIVSGLSETDSIVSK